MTSNQELMHRSFLEEYKELSDTWWELERKAQGTIAIAGAIIAAISALLRVGGSWSVWMGPAVVGTVGSLLVTAFFSIRALRNRHCRPTPRADEVLQVAGEEGFPAALIQSWTQTLQSVRFHLHEKENDLRWGQAFLALSLFWVAFVLGIGGWHRIAPMAARLHGDGFATLALVAFLAVLASIGFAHWYVEREGSSSSKRPPDEPLHRSGWQIVALRVGSPAVAAALGFHCGTAPLRDAADSASHTTIHAIHRIFDGSVNAPVEATSVCAFRADLAKIDEVWIVASMGARDNTAAWTRVREIDEVLRGCEGDAEALRVRKISGSVRDSEYVELWAIRDPTQVSE